MKIYEGIEDFEKTSRDYIDCFISTDRSEVNDLLTEYEFYNIDPKKTGRQSICTTYMEQDHDSRGSSLVNSSNSLEIDCVNIPIEEALGVKKEIGFMPMSKFRIYINGNSNPLTDHMKPFIEYMKHQKQNMAFINSTASKMHVII